MSDKIYIDTHLLEELSLEITGLKNSLSSMKSSVSGSLSEVRRVASSQTGTISKLSKAQQNLALTIEHTSALAKATGNAAALWEDAEKRISSLRLPESNEAPRGDGGGSAYDSKAVAEAIRKSLGYPEDTSTWSKEMWEKYNDLLDTAQVSQTADGDLIIATEDSYIIIGSGATTVVDLTTGFLTGELSVTTYGDDGSYSKTTGSIGLDKAGWDGKILVRDKDGTYKPLKVEPASKIEKKTEDSTKRIGTILQFGVAGSTEAAAIHGEVSGDNGWAEGSAEYSVSHGEAHGSLYAGLYATKVSADGTVHYSFEPGIDAKVGASYSVFDAEASGQVGSDNLNIHGKVGVSALEASAEGNLQLGILDGHIAARASGKVEAIAAEATAEAGINIGGIDGTVSGSVNIGLGAHADVGFHDGKISCDIGASIGLGASVSFELDVSGFVDNVQSTVKGAFEGASQFIGDLLG